MTHRSSRRILIRTDRDITVAVVESMRLAKAAGFSEQDANKISTAVSELARNIVKYAGTGHVDVTTSESGSPPEMQVIASDRGPGIENVTEALKDHYSSSGTLGLGLPGVKRMADRFDITSTPGGGTTVSIGFTRRSPSVAPFSARQATGGRRIARQPATQGHGGTLPTEREMAVEGLDCAYFTRPCRGERLNGDGVFLEQRGDLVFIAIIDGLGHGRSAHDVAATARRYLREHWTEDLAATLEGLHRRLIGSIGAAAGLGLFDIPSRTFRFAGVGNTVARSLGAGGARLASMEGTLGERMRTVRPQSLALRNDDVLVLYTDGVSDRFELSDHPQMQYESAAAIAEAVVQRFGKHHDDATCIAVRYPS